MRGHKHTGDGQWRESLRCYVVGVRACVMTRTRSDDPCLLHHTQPLHTPTVRVHALMQVCGGVLGRRRGAWCCVEAHMRTVTSMVNVDRVLLLRPSIPRFHALHTLLKSCVHCAVGGRGRGRGLGVDVC